MDLRSTPLSYIFNALFRDTPLGHVCCTQPNSQIAKLAKYMDIRLFGYLAACKNQPYAGPMCSIKRPKALQIPS